MQSAHARSIEVTLNLLFNDLRHATRATTGELRDAEQAFDCIEDADGNGDRVGKMRVAIDRVHLLRRELALLDLVEETSATLRAFVRDKYIEKGGETAKE